MPTAHSTLAFLHRNGPLTARQLVRGMRVDPLGDSCYVAAALSTLSRRGLVRRAGAGAAWLVCG